MNNEKTKQWWDTYMANDYFNEFAFCFSRPDLISKFNLQLNSKVLEIGFGYGRETSQFCKLSRHVNGIDIAESAKDIATAKLREYGTTNFPRLLAYDGRNVPFKDGVFDFIYSCYVIQHMSKVNGINMIKEAARTLKPNGKILFEFFGDAEFYKYGLEEDVYSGVPDKIEEGVPYGGMYNNAFSPLEINMMAHKANVNVDWIDTQPITSTFNNYWVCFSKK